MAFWPFRKSDLISSSMGRNGEYRATLKRGSPIFAPTSMRIIAEPEKNRIAFRHTGLGQIPEIEKTINSFFEGVDYGDILGRGAKIEEGEQIGNTRTGDFKWSMFIYSRDNRPQIINQLLALPNFNDASFFEWREGFFINVQDWMKDQVGHLDKFVPEDGPTVTQTDSPSYKRSTEKKSGFGLGTLFVIGAGIWYFTKKR